MTACAGIPTGGTVNSMNGNTLGCRIYHLSVANMSEPLANTHCPHGLPTSATCN